MIKTVSRWYSDRLKQEITLVRWGHWGQPVLLFPTAGGDAEEVAEGVEAHGLAPFRSGLAGALPRLKGFRLEPRGDVA